MSTSIPGGVGAGFSAISREGHFLCDEHGLVVWCNERAAAWFPGLPGRPFWTLAIDEAAARDAQRAVQNGAHSEAVCVRALTSAGPVTLSLRSARRAGFVLVAAVEVADESLRLAGEVEVPARMAASSAHASGRRILLVEDSDDQREVVTMFLESRGHAVVSVADGAAAIAEAARGAFDVAFIDIGLPDVDGFAVAEALRSELGHRTRLFALSGYGFPEDRARSRAAGFDGHLVKPVDPETLATIVSAQASDGSTDGRT